VKPLRINVVGGGPSGLYFAYLMKKASPDSQVTVYEQNAPDATFGFGVVLADRGIERLEGIDPDSGFALRQGMRVNRDQVIYHDGTGVLVDRVGYGGAIGRLHLLRILQSFCAGAGVVLHFEHRADGVAFSPADLTVGADGINSTVRAHGDFGTHIERLTNHFAWYGTQARFEHASLSFRRHQGGHFVAHFYPYCDSMGTFVAECDHATWQRFELEDASEATRQSLIEQIFAKELSGKPLINNKSLWRQFPVITNERWCVDRRVLLGDAMHSAHFSIGSGTRVAIDDAVALWETVRRNDDLDAALAEFAAVRTPSKTKLLDAARASYTWYENFAGKLDTLSPIEFTYDFMTRTGRMDAQRLRNEHPNFMARYERTQAEARTT
jgi:2-polyprenyl-6-methoxyphenol hydroxylase-like FAD-dependent oxidoreductase